MYQNREEVALRMTGIQPGVFFRDPTLSALITGIDETLIRRCSVILQELSSGYRVNATAFDDYAKETAKLRGLEL